MDTEMPMMHRRRSWPLWLAIRAIATGLAGILATVILQSAALPKVQEELRDVRKPQATSLVLRYQKAFIAVPGLAVALGVAAIVLRPLRAQLAVLAAIAGVLTLFSAVAMLIAMLGPLYRMPDDLGLT